MIKKKIILKIKKKIFGKKIFLGKIFFFFYKKNYYQLSLPPANLAYYLAN